MDQAADIIDTDQIADAVEAPPAEAPTVIATAAELMAWRASPVRKPGDSFAYFASSSSLMRERSRSVAAEKIGAAVYSMYLAGRAVPVFQRNGMGGVYSVQAVDGAPVKSRL
jgi:hypothetical protein